MHCESQQHIYHSSGKVAWERFGPAAIICFAGAFMLADPYLWHWLTTTMTSLFLPFIVAALLVLPVRAIVAWGKCRSPSLAGLLGAITGCALCAGFDYFGVAPVFVHGHVHQSVMELSAVQIIEALLILLILTFAGLGRAKQVYCEQCDRWSQRDTVCLQGTYANVVAQWYHNGELQNLTTQQPVSATGGRRERVTTIAIEYCDASNTCPIYFSVKVGYTNFDGVAEKFVIAPTTLAPLEMAHLVPTFPQLKRRSLDGLSLQQRV